MRPKADSGGGGLENVMSGWDAVPYVLIAGPKMQPQTQTHSGCRKAQKMVKALIEVKIYRRPFFCIGERQRRHLK